MTTTMKEPPALAAQGPTREEIEAAASAFYMALWQLGHNRSEENPTWQIAPSALKQVYRLAMRKAWDQADIVAHIEWSEAMRRDGWDLGDKFEGDAKRHPMLKGWEALTEFQQFFWMLACGVGTAFRERKQ